MSVVYENRICCFIDILGFREHIKASASGDQDSILKIKSILEILGEANELVKQNTENEYRLSKQITQFSDSIVISFKIEDGAEIPMTLINILHLCIQGVVNGYLFRGGISYGKLFHNDKYLFGPAIVNAYDIENKAAVYPRILLDKTILDLAKKYTDSDHTPEEVEDFLKSVVTKDMDGMYYVDYVSKAPAEFHNTDKELRTYIDKLKGLINQNINNSSYDIKTKYGWLKSKTNVLIHAIKLDTRNIERLKRVDSELASYYKELKMLE